MRFGLSAAAKAIRHFTPLGSLAKLKLHDPWQVRALIGREQARAARRRRPLSVVLFRASSRIGRAGLVRLLLRRARDTDSIGLVDANRLCAVLADTDEAGARHYAEQVHKLAAKQGIVIEEMVHTTPIPAATGRAAEEAAARDIAWLDEPDARDGAGNTNTGTKRAFRELLDWLAGSAEASILNQPARPATQTAKQAPAPAAARLKTAEAPDDADELVERLAGASGWGS